ncbi:MAG: hypothetical protein ACKOGP_09985 [Bacteroidota bacterium]
MGSIAAGGVVEEKTLVNVLGAVMAVAVKFGLKLTIPLELAYKCV